MPEPSDPPTTPSERPESTLHPVAVAIGNASLLGVGYLLLGRRWLAAGAVFVALVLVVLLVTVRWTGFEVALGVWWLAVTVHGWYLARRSVVPAARWQWAAALGVTLPLLLVVGLLRFDAAGVDRQLAVARTAGDCAQAGTATDRIWWGHRVVDAPMTARADTTDVACSRLDEAGRKLAATAAGKPIARLATGFDELPGVLRDQPGHEAMVARTLDEFLAGLPTAPPCPAAMITDWLIARPTTGDVLDRAGPSARATAPAALVGCGDALMSTQDWDGARERYQQLVDLYPDDALQARAREGVTRAVQARELETVRGLLKPDTLNGSPAYCTSPAPYSAAPAYGSGVNKALIFGNKERTDPLPAEWRAGDAADAVVVVCVGDDGDVAAGQALGSCNYTNVGERGVYRTTFHKVTVPVTVIELRTGRPVVETTLQISGPSCPQNYTYLTFGRLAFLPGPSDFLVEPSPGDLRAAFAPLIER